MMQVNTKHHAERISDDAIWMRLFWVRGDDTGLKLDQDDQQAGERTEHLSVGRRENTAAIAILSSAHVTVDTNDRSI